MDKTEGWTGGEDELAHGVESDRERNDGSYGSDPEGEALDGEIKTGDQVNGFLGKVGDVPGFTAQEQENGSHHHTHAIQGGHGQHENQEQLNETGNDKGDMEEQGAEGDDDKGAQSSGKHAAHRHAEQDGHHLVGSDDVERQVTLLFLPIQLAGHTPKHVQPKGGHGSAHDGETNIILRGFKGAVDEYIGGDRKHGQEDVKEQPGFFTLLPDQARVGTGIDRLQEKAPAGDLGQGRIDRIDRGSCGKVSHFLPLSLPRQCCDQPAGQRHPQARVHAW